MYTLQRAYVGMLVDLKKNERDLSARSFLVVLIVQELLSLDWDERPDNQVRGADA